MRTMREARRSRMNSLNGMTALNYRVSSRFVSVSISIRKTKGTSSSVCSRRRTLLCSFLHSRSILEILSAGNGINLCSLRRRRSVCFPARVHGEGKDDLITSAGTPSGHYL
jgi:hypothetical protein